MAFLMIINLACVLANGWFVVIVADTPVLNLIVGMGNAAMAGACFVSWAFEERGKSL